jgi:hypothetical protein
VRYRIRVNAYATRPKAEEGQYYAFRMLIPMKEVGDSDLMPVTRFETIPIAFGAKRR